MLAVMKTSPKPGLEVVDFPEPRVGDNEVTIDIKASGICGTDVAVKKWMEWAANIIGDKLPVIIGHEFGGDIIEVGKNVQNFKKGDRVVVEPFITCGICYFCSIGRPNLCERRYYLGMHRHGGMAKYSSVPESVLYKIPDSIPYYYIPLLETLATNIHPIERLIVFPGDTVAIIGPGPIGLCLMQTVKASGAARVIVTGIAIDKPRLQVAKDLGADLTIVSDEENVVEKVLSFTAGLGVDAAFDATGTKAGITDALNMVRRGGEVCIVGVSDDPVPIKPFSQLMMREVNIISSLARTPSSWYRAIKLVETGKVKLDPLIGKRMPLKDALKAFETLEGREAVKVILEP
jgi:2-desacetyl-2-hydroxyethyl bacteriochlorophyllide A dehydrogenase